MMLITMPIAVTAAPAYIRRVAITTGLGGSRNTGVPVLACTAGALCSFIVVP
jgi:hypothetical protein